MPLTDVLERLYARRRFGIKPGVDRVAELLNRLGHPEQQFRTIHVVGTNGKGSTSAFLSSILKESGHSVAQFSSPHLVNFSERFRINGSEYPADQLADRLATVLEIAPDEATFFEITTALAASIFCEQQVEFAVMEAGMGGESDATAAFNGEMTLITPISFDHTDYLGSTLAAIATEKAGIIKPGTPVISAGQLPDVRQVIEEKCGTSAAPLMMCGREFSAEWRDDGTLDYQSSGLALSRLTPGIAGRFQAENCAVALAAAETLMASGTSMTPHELSRGVMTASWPGRMELVPGEPPLLLDGAHNPAGAEALATALQQYSYKRLLLVTGVCHDKDLEGIYAPLLPLVAEIYTVTPAIDRAMTDADLASALKARGTSALPSGSVTEGVARACADALPGDLVLVCGSLFVVGEVKAGLANTLFTGIRG